MATQKKLTEIQAEALAATPIDRLSAQILDDLAEAVKPRSATLFVRNGNDVDNGLTLTGSWQRMDRIFDRIRDTSGLQDGMTAATDPGAWVKVRNQAAGTFSTGAGLVLNITTPGKYQIRAAQWPSGDAESKGTGFQCTRNPTVAGECVFVIGPESLIKDVAAQTLLQPEIKGPAGARVYPNDGQFTFAARGDL